MPKNFAYWVFLVLIFAAMIFVLAVGTIFLLQEYHRMFESAINTLGMLTILLIFGALLLFRK
jgi:Mn2+/Fe2+ NRAMP family transporter